MGKLRIVVTEQRTREIVIDVNDYVSKTSHVQVFEFINSIRDNPITFLNVNANGNALKSDVKEIIKLDITDEEDTN